ncbi:hypothetical protein N7G274_008061 [Stereocaulon virgatum]|uniref:Uncharacterized protein n=1 Tax=Stereocaulon virgatum TaxID=373712 RepID=A0ABR3ZZ90_9LECA
MRKKRRIIPKRSNFLGLRYRDTLRDYGTVWFPPDMIDWGALPMFKRPILRRLALAQQDLAFQQVFHATRDIQGKLTRESIRIQRLREMLRDTRQRRDTICTAAELVVQKYIQTVFAIVLRRATEGIRNRAEVRRIQQQMTDQLTPHEFAGYHGLSHDLVCRLLGHHPLIAFGRGSRSPKVYFTSHASGLWRHRIQELFQWDDHAGRKLRGWDTEPFRQLAREIYRIVEQEVDAETASSFFSTILQKANENLLILLHYDCDKLSVLQKRLSSTEPGDASLHPRAIPPLERTQWIMAQVPPEDRDAYYEVKRYKGKGIPSAAAVICEKVSAGSLMVCGTDKVEKDKMAGVLYVPSLFGISMKLEHARRFNRLLGQKTGDEYTTEESTPSATDEEESDDEGEDDEGEYDEEENDEGEYDEGEDEEGEDDEGEDEAGENEEGEEDEGEDDEGEDDEGEDDEGEDDEGGK